MKHAFVMICAMVTGTVLTCLWPPFMFLFPLILGMAHHYAPEKPHADL